MPPVAAGCSYRDGDIDCEKRDAFQRQYETQKQFIDQTIAHKRAKRLRCSQEVLCEKSGINAVISRTQISYNVLATSCIGFWYPLRSRTLWRRATVGRRDQQQLKVFISNRNLSRKTRKLILSANLIIFFATVATGCSICDTKLPVDRRMMTFPRLDAFASHLSGLWIGTLVISLRLFPCLIGCVWYDRKMGVGQIPVF